MVNLDGLSHRELNELVMDATARLKEFGAVRLRIKAKRCGKAECYCSEGPSDGSWENFHGPYVFAQFVDNVTKKMRTISLGRHYGPGDIIEAAEKILDDWFDYFTITPPEAEKIKERGDEPLWYINLSSERFKDYYGLEIHEDRLSRHMIYYATKQKYQAYETAQRLRDETRAALRDDLAVTYGIGSVLGQKKLRQLLCDKYYLVDELTRD